MIQRIRPEEFIPLLREGQPWVAGCVLEEIHLLPCSTLRKAARENHFQAFKVGTLIFYNADEVAQFVSDVDRIVDEKSGLIALPSPSQPCEVS